MKFSDRLNRANFWLLLLLAAPMLIAVPAFAQYNYSNWVMKNATDTSAVRCWTDSATTIAFPPGSMSGMMMNMPDSIYCRIDEMPMDSLMLAHDSTFIGWYRVQIGKDSMDFNMMSFSGIGSGNMMQFEKGIMCHLYWDSVTADSMYRHSHPTGIMAWNGSNWVTVSYASINGNDASLTTTVTYSAIAFVGTPDKPTEVVSHSGTPLTFSLSQNYPNPFNPTTVISYQLPAVSHVTLKVYDILGNEVATLVNGTQSAGVHTAEFSGANLASGIYFYRLSTPNNVKTMKMILLK
ncbi:MAG TPA: T9SS type A sorting domain-containing protein [Candidatus Kryptobacter bacterium]|nr:T9SS type A sorting domain-containing protein [Candidatus Kryptobacter bacterium]